MEQLQDEVRAGKLADIHAHAPADGTQMRASCWADIHDVKQRYSTAAESDEEAAEIQPRGRKTSYEPQPNSSPPPTHDGQC